ncbi:MAG TPA: hypothetical protein VD886_01835 [Herpetosiphonaceae bacterium]|nr:hypothetical protein [Herpetosiphonaceae bacterium]
MRRIMPYVLGLACVALVALCLWAATGGRESPSPEVSKPMPPAGAPANQQECRQKGGAWGAQGMQGTLMCNLPAADAGQRCTGSEQCEGLCMAAPAATPEPGGEVAGKCSPRQIVFGCHTLVEDGRIVRSCRD